MQFVQRLIKIALLVGLVTGSTYAQDQSTILRPILGFTVDRTGASISPILGVAGASILDQSLELGMEIRNVVVSADHDYALMERSDDAKIILSKLRENLFPLELPGLHTGPSLIAISPTGS